MNYDYDKSIWALNRKMGKPEYYNNQEKYKKASEQWRQLTLLQKQNIEDDESIRKNQQRDVSKR